jgi:predicted transcriptional regulator YdeE
MNSHSHPSFEVSGYVVTIPNPQQAQTVIKEAWHKFMQEGLVKQVEHKAYPGVHAVYYNYHDLDNPNKKGYDVLLGFITETGAKQTNPEFKTIIIPEQTYMYSEISGEFDKILASEWEKINQLPKSEVNRSYGFDLEMYSEDYKTATLAVSVKAENN